MTPMPKLLPGYDPDAQAGDCEFKEEIAQRHIDFIEECCTFTQGELTGEPFLLQPWQKAVVANLYGWKRPNGTRRYRVAFIFVGCGNGKSELGAALVCTALFVPDQVPEPGGHIFSAAGKRDQTRYVFDPVVKMVEACPEMRSRATVLKNSITVGDRSYWSMARETHTGTEHGGATAFAVADELHAHLDGRLIVALKRGMVKRRQPILVCMSTSDHEREGSPCNQMHDYASKVRDGIIEDPTFLPAIYEAAKEDDWTDPEIWRKANPNLGVSVIEENLADLCQNARNDPLFENEFKRLHLNIRTESVTRWVTTEAWDACEEEVRIEDFAGQKCWCGLDLAATEDFNAFVVAFRQEERCVVFPYFWVPELTARRRDLSSGVPYLTWARQRYLTLTEGATSDYDVIRRDINEVVTRHKLNVQEMAADRLFQGLDLCRRLEEEDGYTVFAHGMGMLGMALPTKETKRVILSGQLAHSGHPVLRWMIANTVVQTDAAGNEKPNREKSGDKIDGTVAMIMAAGRAMLEEDTGSVYDREDVKEVGW